jgi:hypothetical protein
MKHNNKKTRKQEYKQHIQNNTVKSFLQIIQIIQLSMLPLSSIFAKFKHHTEVTKADVLLAEICLEV